MLDTIKLKYTISPTPEQLQHWQRRTMTTQTGTEKESYLYNPTIANDEIMVKYTYFPLAYNEEPLLTLEVSLPKLIHGNNFQMIGSIEGTIQMGNIILELVPYVPQLDLGEGILIRLDMCYNHQVGELVDDYIKAIGYLDYPHRRTKYHRYEGTEFRSKHKTTKFYNKEREAGTPDAWGILRQEATILKGRNIRTLTGKKQPTLKDINREFVAFHLNSDLDKLRLSENEIGNKDTVLKRLCEVHGNYAGMYYYAFLISKMEKSKKRIINEIDINPRTLDYKLRKIVDTGIPLTMTDREEPLPPLTINL